MLYAVCRCTRLGVGRLLRFFLLVGCFLSPGCGGEGERLISVKLTDATGMQKVQCVSFHRWEIFAGIRAEEAAKAGKDRYEFLASDGELLMIKLSGKDDKSADEMSFPYVFRGDEKTPLVFSRRPGLAMLNGKVVCVDLSDKAGAQWITHQPDAKLKTIRTLLLSDDAATDAAVLTRMAGSGITIALSDKIDYKSATAPSPAAESEEIRALIAVKPACIRIPKIEQNMIVQLPNLTHLMISGQKMPDLTGLKKLRFLGLSDVTNLAPLTNLTGLQGLRLEKCDGVVDFTPLRKLTHLRTLYIGGAEKLADLDVFTDMRELRSLTLGLDKESKIKSVAPLTKLMNLTELAIFPMPPNVKDLSALKKLKNLKMLVVDNDGLKKRQEEYDEIRQALPECQVVGFCMGSAWILVVVPAAVGLGVWRRRRSATGKAA